MLQNKRKAARKTFPVELDEQLHKDLKHRAIEHDMTLHDYIENLISVFKDVRRILRPDGTLWLNIANTYTSGGRAWRDSDAKNKGRAMSYRPDTPSGLKPKDLTGVAWMLAMALQRDGWYL